MKSTRLVLAVLWLLLLGRVYGQYCTSDTRFTEVPFFNAAEITVGTNVQFAIATDYAGNPDTLRMDLYYPNPGIDPAAQRPFIMLFHGGGFSSGDKASGDITDICAQLALRGFVCASVNYRLGHDFSEYGQFKARYRAIQDGHAAMRFVVSNANTVRIDTSWMFIGGQSAGALLALGMVYADPAELDSVALAYGPTALSTELGNLYTSGNALTQTYTFKGVLNNWGAIPENEVDAEEMLPTIAFHGALDTVVRIDADNSFLHYTLNGSRALHNTLTANQVCSEITVDPAGEHGIYRNASTAFRAGRASCFLKSIFCNNCADFYAEDSIPPTCSNPLGVSGDDAATRIQVFPNPFEHTFRIEGLTGRAELQVYNATGQLLYQALVYNGEIQVQAEPGLYFLRLRQLESGQTFTTTLLKP